MEKIQGLVAFNSRLCIQLQQQAQAQAKERTHFESIMSQLLERVPPPDAELPGDAELPEAVAAPSAVSDGATDAHVVCENGTKPTRADESVAADEIRVPLCFLEQLGERLSPPQLSQLKRAIETPYKQQAENPWKSSNKRAK